MALYPVRCCCQPTKVFGHLELRDGLPDGAMPVVHEYVKMQPSPVGPTEDHGPVSTYVRHHIVQLRRFRDLDRGIDQLAVYSDDRPIEFWRNIQGFHEAGSARR